MIDDNGRSNLPIILGHPILATIGSLTDVMNGTLTLYISGDKQEFHMCHNMNMKEEDKVKIRLRELKLNACYLQLLFWPHSKIKRLNEEKCALVVKGLFESQTRSKMLSKDA